MGLSAISIFTFGQLAEISKTVNTFTGDLMQERDAIQKIPSHILQIQIQMDGYINTPRQTDLDKAKRAFDILASDLVKVIAASRNAPRRQQLNAIREAINSYKQTFADITVIIQRRQNIYRVDMDEVSQAMGGEGRVARSRYVLRGDLGFFGVQ